MHINKCVFLREQHLTETRAGHEHVRKSNVKMMPLSLSFGLFSSISRVVEAQINACLVSLRVHLEMARFGLARKSILGAPSCDFLWPLSAIQMMTKLLTAITITLWSFGTVGRDKEDRDEN